MLGYAKGYLSGWTSDLHCPYCKQYPDFDSATWDLLDRGDREELVVECSACGKKFMIVADRLDIYHIRKGRPGEKKQ